MTNLSSLTQSIETAETESEFLAVIAQLEQAEAPEEWLKYYYLCLCHILLSMVEMSAQKKDDYLDEGEKYLRRALLLRKNDDEILVLNAFWLQAKIMVSVISRGPLYIGKVENLLEEAQAINHRNPRAYFLLGQSYLNKPSIIGGGKRKAKPYLLKAKELYEHLPEQKNGYPEWGKNQVLELLESF